MGKNILLSEELTNRYGMIKINILHQDNDYRTSILVDGDGNPKSIAVCMFSKELFSEGLKSAHEKIMKGGLIGETIKNCGYNVIKMQRCRFLIDTPILFNTGKIEQTNGRFYDITAENSDGKVEIYGTICEIYHPELHSSKGTSSMLQGQSSLLKQMLQYLNLETSKINII
jgi:hypothetical protein